VEIIQMRNIFGILTGTTLVAFLAAPLAASGQTVRYQVVELQPAAGAAACVPMALNDAGDVVGYCSDQTGSFGVVWTGGQVTSLGKWGEGIIAEALGINSLGEIVGRGDDGGDLRMWALAWRERGWMQIDGSGGSSQQAYGITDDGVIFGNYSSTGAPGTEDWAPVFWTWNADNQRYDRNDLPKPQGTISGAFIYAVTKAGVAVGQVASDAGNLAGLWNNDAIHSLVELGTPLGFNSAAAFAVSDNRHAAGAAFLGGLQMAVLWQDDGTHTPILLGALPGDINSEAQGVNSAGQVVGFSFNPLSTARGFLYQNGAIAELTSLLDPTDAGWAINEAFGINNAGAIIAVGTLNNEQHAVMLVPSEVTVPKVSAVALTADRTAPQIVGTTVTFMASAIGGQEPIRFKWLLDDGSTTTTLRDWSTAGAFEWTPAAPNASYRVTVWARSDGNDANVPESSAAIEFPIVARPVSSVTLTADKTAPQIAGTTVTFTAAATDGADPIQFKWFVWDGVASTVVGDWSTMRTLAWTPGTANASYSVTVWARSAGNEADAAESQTSMPFAIVPKPLSSVALAADKLPGQLLGTTVTFTATPTDGIAPIEFKWLVSDGPSTVATEWSTAATFTWTPTKASLSYSVTVWARSAGNTVDAPEKSATMAFAILPNPLSGIVAMSVDKKSPQKPGTTVTFTANWVGATAAVQYKWLVHEGTSLVATQEWSTDATFGWTPMVAGNYTVSVWARAVGNDADAPEKSAQMTFAIKGKAPKQR
jgi:probable HAF family extracellular repeat protein